MSSTLPISSEQTRRESSDGSFDLVEMLLDEQRALTAVERFSSLHDSGDLRSQTSDPHWFRELLPASPPGRGEQFSFEVNLDACSGCKACVVACHTLNGLEDDESWRRVGTVTIGETAQPRLQHVTTACHHCEDPGCLNGCPVAAYEKDPSSGIVRHLDDQCIGCKYCTMMCPYEVPRYSKRLGIVRKCDMCHQRLSVGEAPACVQSCPNEAISIKIVERTNHREDTDRLAPGAPLSTITRPTTNYVSSQGTIAGGIAQDARVDHVAESHWPLAAMLVGTQISVGTLLVERIVATGMWATGQPLAIETTRIAVAISLLIALVGMGVSPLHLGQPTRAWRVMLGLRTSWLSREAVLFGKYVGALLATAAVMWLPIAWTEMLPTWTGKALLGTSLLVGLVGVYCSAMIYIATQRQLWRHGNTLIRFFGTAAIGGLTVTSLAMVLSSASLPTTVLALLAGATAIVGKMMWEWRTHLAPNEPGETQGQDHESTLARRSRRLVNQQLATVRGERIWFGFAAAALLAMGTMSQLTIGGIVSVGLVGVGAAVLVAAEFCERVLYFSSVVYDRMPGTLK